MSTQPIAKDPSGSPSRLELARRLGALLDEIVFDIEHGIPWRVIHDLETVQQELRRIAGHEPRLRDEVAAFGDALNELFVSDDAADQVLQHGQRIGTILRDERDDDSATECDPRSR